MRRYPAYDPPEYVDWTPDPNLVEAYRERVETHPDRAAHLDPLGNDELLALYRDLLRTRLHDWTLKRWVRQGVISKAWLGTGEEAVTVGAVSALDRQRDRVYPMIRNAGACHMMGMPLADLFRGYLASRDGPNGGRDVHIGAPELGVIPPVSQMGTNVGVMTGVAMGLRDEGQGGVGLTWIGDGGAKTGVTHEGINLAAVQNAPAVFVLQNNQVALGTTVARHGRGNLEAWPEMYGLPARSCDGNNVLDVYAACRWATELGREGGGPAMVVATTFRMGGHATHDEREAREILRSDAFEAWGRRDPVGLYEAYLVERGLDQSRLEDVEGEVVQEVEEAEREALASRDRTPPPERARYEGISENGTLVGLEMRPV